MDFTLVEHPSGELLVHAPNCPQVQAAREAGWPLATLFGCERLPAFVPIASCLQGLADGGRRASA